MSTKSNKENATDHGATLVITHRLKDNKSAEYEEWMKEVTPVCRSFPGHLDWHIIRPIAGLTETYTIVIRFDTKANLQNWLESSDRSRLIAKVQPLFVSGDDFFISSGLDFWFTPSGAKAKLPVRWKQFLVTWSAISPLSIGVPMLITPTLKKIGLPSSIHLTTLVGSGLIVFLMVYLIMPRYTRLIQKWLFT